MYYLHLTTERDFSGGSDGKVVKPTMQETWVQSLDWEDLLEKEMASHWTHWTKLAAMNSLNAHTVVSK